MALPSLTLMALTLTCFRLPAVDCTLYTVRQGHRLNSTPLVSLTFQGGQGSSARCIMTCRLTDRCISVNSQMDSVTSVVTCELLDVYLHQTTNSLTSASGWVFIQEDPVYTETSWALAFRASSAVGQSVWDTLQEDGRHDDPVEMRECVLSASSLPCLTHFRSYIVDHWSNTDQVRITLYKDTAQVAQLTFDGQGSTRTSWLDTSRIVTSSWADLTSSSSTNYFSISGLPHVYRRFYLSAFHNGCPGDSGWLVVADFHPEPTVSGQCSWENTQPVKPTIFFSPLSTAAAWESSSEIADFMMIHVTFIA